MRHPFQRPGASYVRLIHAAPGTGPVDVYVDGQALLKNFAYATLTDYQTLPSGSHLVQITPTGKGIDAAVIKQTVAFDTGIPYTVAAIGTATTGLSLTEFIDDNTIASTALAKVRLYHLSPDTGPLNIQFSSSTVNGLAYKQSTPYALIPPGKYPVTGTLTQANSKVTATVDLGAGYVSSAFVIGLAASDPKVQFVATRVKAIPGTPFTGSDPNAKPVPPSSFPVWALAALAVGILVVTVTATVYRCQSSLDTAKVSLV